MIIVIRCWFVNSSEWIDSIPIVKSSRIHKVILPGGTSPAGLFLYEQWGLLVTKAEYEEINRYIKNGDYDVEIEIVNF